MTSSTPDRVEGLARALAGAAHLNPRRQTPVWDDLTCEQRDRYLSDARAMLDEERP